MVIQAERPIAGDLTCFSGRALPADSSASPADRLSGRTKRGISWPVQSNSTASTARAIPAPDPTIHVAISRRWPGLRASTGWLAACLVAMIAGHAVPGSAAGPGDAAAATAVVGLTSAPPFAMRDAEGAWQGIAVDLWRTVAADLGLQFEFRELAIPELTTGLQSGALFAVATATASADREPIMEFSHPYYTSQLVIAVRSGPDGGGRWLDSLRSFASVGLMKTAGVVIGLLVLAGALVWLVERRANPEQFPAAARQGVGAGLWWAAVTMTTVGYGDKAPRTGLGRALGVVWMFAAIVLIALLTAQVTSSLTVSSLSGIVRGPDDLVRVRVGALEDSPPKAWLREKLGVAATGFPGFADGLRAVDRGDLDAFVGVEPVLRYEIANSFAGRLRVVGVPFTRADYVFAFPNGSPMRRKVNQAILAHIETDAWQATLRHYLGANS